MLRYYLGVLPAALARKPWPHPAIPGKYNALQRGAYFTMPLLGALVVLSGWAMHKPAMLPWLERLFGTYDVARVVHFSCMAILGSFMVPHVILVAADGGDTFRSMVTGWSTRLRGAPHGGREEARAPAVTRRAARHRDPACGRGRRRAPGEHVRRQAGRARLALAAQLPPVRRRRPGHGGDRLVGAARADEAGVAPGGARSPRHARGARGAHARAARGHAGSRAHVRRRRRRGALLEEPTRADVRPRGLQAAAEQLPRAHARPRIPLGLAVEPVRARLRSDREPPDRHAHVALRPARHEHAARLRGGLESRRRRGRGPPRRPARGDVTPALH